MEPMIAPDRNGHMFHSMDPMAFVGFLAVRLWRLLIVRCAHRNTTLPYLSFPRHAYPNSQVIILQSTAGSSLIYTTHSYLRRNPLTTPRILEECSSNPWLRLRLSRQYLLPHQKNPFYPTQLSTTTRAGGWVAQCATVSLREGTARWENTYEYIINSSGMSGIQFNASGKTAVRRCSA